ncbi:MAG: YggS family pyridoxal phosphate-dependent enzyme [Myxococcota bacterium]
MPGTDESAEIGRALGVSEAAVNEASRRLTEVQARIQRAADRAKRDPNEVQLVGVAKRQPEERILAAVAAGVHVLGQSYIQEAREIRPTIEAALSRWPANATPPPPALRWHMVGRLQRNKAGLAARLFETIESVDRPELADKLARCAEQEGKVLDVLIQLSLCGEPQKGGCEIDALEPLAEKILASPTLRLKGLMTVPAAGPDPESSRPAFAQLRELREGLSRLDPSLADGALSMGMSGDLEVAVEEGATLIRVGTALFGERVS